MITDLDINEGVMPTLDEDLQDNSAIMEAFLLDDLGRMSFEERTALIESSEMEMLINEGMIGRRSLVRLSKQDDLFRRKKIIAMQMGKEKNDRLYNEIIKHRMKERQAMGLLLKKYGTHAEREAKKGQKAYLKTSPITTKIVAGAQDLNYKKLFDAKTGMMKRVSTVEEEGED